MINADNGVVLRNNDLKTRCNCFIMRLIHKLAHSGKKRKFSAMC